MKRLLAALLILILIFSIGGCSDIDESDNNISDSDIDWSGYNEAAETFVATMAAGDFDAAVSMFDNTMKRLVTPSALQNDVWNIVLRQAGNFVAPHEIENLFAEGYYICFITSRHETRGVTLRIVFSEACLIAGLFIEGYPAIAEEVTQHEGFTDYPIVIGEGTDYPLSGILSMPSNTTDRVPAVVLVHGSGPQDMDETIYENKPFRDIAEYLASKGIAVIRYDKRTFTHGAQLMQEFGGSLTVVEETLADAILATEILKSDPRIDENKVFILGHSLGGMLAPRIHAEGGNYAGLILLAGSPRSLLDIIYDQQMAVIEEMPEGNEKTNLLEIMETYDQQAQGLLILPDNEAKATPMSGASAYYFKEMHEHPASEYIKEITVPFLVLQGTKDFQVYPDKDFAIYQQLLEGRTNATLKLYEGLNHLFMTSTGRNITEYQEEYKTANQVDIQVLIDIAEWIKAT